MFPLQEPVTLNALVEQCSCPTRVAGLPRPSAIPFEPTKENILRLKEWIIQHYASSAFNTCEHQPLPCMSGDPLEIHLGPNTKLTAYHTPIPVPHHWKTQVKSDLDCDVRLGIIGPVPPGTPTAWYARMIVVPKRMVHRTELLIYRHSVATYHITNHTPAPSIRFLWYHHQHQVQSGCLEWVSFYASEPGCKQWYNFHDKMGPVQIPSGTTRITSSRRWLHEGVRWLHYWLIPQDEMHQWYPPLGQYNWLVFLAYHQLYLHMCQKWCCVQSEEIPLRTGRHRICWV